MTKGKLRVLFGCGGDRDRTKRPRALARVAATKALMSSTSPATIRGRKSRSRSSMKSSPDFPPIPPAQIVVEPDRRTAIERIIGDAEPGDVVLLAGKGHENYQIIGTSKIPFDDCQEAQRVLQRAWAA